MNAPGLCTISGPAEKVADALRRLEAAGIECRALHTSHAFHSTMMEPALKPFEVLLATVDAGAADDSRTSRMSPEPGSRRSRRRSPAYYAAHLRQAVRFEAGVRTLAAEPSLFLLEVGPGNVLTTLVRGMLGSERAKHHRVIAVESPPEATATCGRCWRRPVACGWPAYPVVERNGGRRRPTSRSSADLSVRAHAIRCRCRAGRARGRSGARRTVRRIRSVGQHLYAPTWARDELVWPRSPRLHGVWIVLGDRAPLTEAVVDRLQAAGATPILAEAGTSYRTARSGPLSDPAGRSR